MDIRLILRSATFMREAISIQVPTKSIGLHTNQITRYLPPPSGNVEDARPISERVVAAICVSNSAAWVCGLGTQENSGRMKSDDADIQCRSQLIWLLSF